MCVCVCVCLCVCVCMCVCVCVWKEKRGGVVREVGAVYDSLRKYGAL